MPPATPSPIKVPFPGPESSLLLEARVGVGVGVLATLMVVYTVTGSPFSSVVEMADVT